MFIETDKNKGWFFFDIISKVNTGKLYLFEIYIMFEQIYKQLHSRIQSAILTFVFIINLRSFIYATYNCFHLSENKK